jgi:micrococcal nuclease
MNPHIYRADITRVVDGDTCDVTLHLGFDILYKGRVRLTGIDTPESRTRDLEEKKKGLAAKDRNKHLLEQGVFKLKSFGTGKFGRVLGEIFVDPEVVGEHITECINDSEHHIDIDESGWVSVNDILIEEGHAYEYHGEKKKDFETEMAKEKAAAFEEKSEV